jgi:hypothetical protein
VRKEIKDFPAVPDVVSSGDHIDPAGEQFLCETGRDAESGSGVFAVRDAEVDLSLRKDVRESVQDDLATGRTNDVADE